MTGDFSRMSLDRAKSYTGVLMQQGRVQVDADWNEELALRLHRTRAEAYDVIGGCGTPKGLDGFKLSPTPPGDDLFIHSGRYYVDGLLCEIVPERAAASIELRAAVQTHPHSYVAILASTWLDGRPISAGDWLEIDIAGKRVLNVTVSAVSDPGALFFDAKIPTPALDKLTKTKDVGLRRAPTYLTQPFYPSPDREPGLSGSPPPAPGSPPGTGLTLADGTYLAYLEAWEREVNALEDPHIREVALGGPDTAERLQTVWQVRLLQVTGASGSDLCTEQFSQWDQLVAAFATTGTMNARSVPQKPDTNPCCMTPPSAGFLGLQNQLYRIEILHPGDESTATIVWSRDNAMVETVVVSVDTAHPNVITVADLGKDDLHQFAVNDWVELVDRDSELVGAPRFLAQIVAPAPDPNLKSITLSAPVPDAASINNPGTNVFRLRRWDMTGAALANGVPIKSGWMDIESGIQVEFGKGFYAPRAYWLVPARIATADIEWPPFQVPNSEPVPQPPLGTPRHFCRIASIEVAKGMWKLADCRKPFPPLTHICADDVCYESRCDALQAEKTVQDALDKLCDLSKLRFHKKMLHGWGIVCGLQARCAGDEHSVKVLSGYAIDCEGSDILFKETSFDFISAITTPSGVMDGEYSLILDPKVKGQLRVAPYLGPPETLQQALGGTFWPNYYDQYLAPLLKYFDSLSGTPPPVTESEMLVSSLVNLAAQYNDAKNGGKVYISVQEDAVLNKIYQDVLKLLFDLTFCGFKSNMHAMPKYPEGIGGITSIFAFGTKSRIRINAAGTEACTVGTDNTIHIYSLAKSSLTTILTLPTSGAVVQDAIFSPDGQTLIAIATTGSDSVVASVPLDQGAPWSTGTVAGVTLRSLANPKAGIYAIGVGKGLYLITPASGAIVATAVTGAQFVAVGHLIAGGQENTLFATWNSSSDSTKFDRIMEILPNGTTATTKNFIPTEGFTGTWQDDIAVAGVPTQVGFHIYVTGLLPGATNKVLLMFTMTNTDGGGTWRAQNLSENTQIRFAANPDRQVMLMAYAGSSHIDAVATTQAPDITFTPNYYPAEVNPVSMATDATGKAVYVLNGEANTISRIPFAIAPWTAQQFATLLKYRDELLAAYWDFLDAILQYLKDGFCDLLLVDCPSCTGDETLYVAGVSVRGAQVYKVCNFSLRKYVHTFPTVEYWLSVVPIFPILGWVIRRLCCEVFSNTFANSEKFVTNAKSRTLAPSANLSVRHAATRLAELRQITGKFPQLLAAAPGFAGDYVAALFKPVPGTTQSGIAVSPGQNAQTVAQQLGAANVTVDTVAYDSTKLAENIARAASAPNRIQPGTAAVLVVDAAGNVRYAFQGSDQVQLLQTQMATVQAQQAATAAVLQTAAQLHDQVLALTAQISDLKQSQATELAARDAKILALSNTTQAMQQQIQRRRPRAPPSPPPRG
jgi:hypothetical protein